MAGRVATSRLLLCKTSSHMHAHCAPCGRRLPTVSSQRDNFRDHVKAKCKSCLQALESAERTTAASSAAVSAGEQQQQQQQQLFHCSGCNQGLAQVRFRGLSAFKRPTMNDAASLAWPKAQVWPLLTQRRSQAPYLLRRAQSPPPPPNPIQPLSYNDTKQPKSCGVYSPHWSHALVLTSRPRLRSVGLAVYALCQQRSKQSRHAEPLLRAGWRLTCNGLVKDLSRVLKADVAQKIASDLASHAKKAVERIQAMHEEHEALEADHGGGRAQGGHGGSSSASRAAIDVATGSAVVQERGAMLRLSLSGTPKPYVEISKEVKTPKMTPHRPIRSACSVFLTQSESPASHGRPARSTLTSWRDVMRNRLCCRVACFARVRCRSFCDIRASVRTDIKHLTSSRFRRLA